MAFFEIKNLRSNTINRKVSVDVIVPFDSKVRQHPKGEIFRTLMLLHGMRDNNFIWTLETRIHSLAERYNICVIMPNGENGFYLNHDDSYTLYEDFVCGELLDMMRTLLPISDKREDTFIGGFSMGGYGSLRNGLKHHDVFSKICALSPGLTPEYAENYSSDDPVFFHRPEFVRSHMGDLKEAKNSDKNPLWLIDKLAAEGVELPEIYMTTGTEDPLISANHEIAEHLRKAGAKFTAFSEPGIHDWDFINRQLERAIAWLAGEKA